MVVGGKYELGAITAESEGWRTFEGRELQSGRAVFVHRCLEPPSGSPRPTHTDLAERYGHVIDTCSCDGVEYVVTEALPRGAGEERFTRVGAWRVPASFRAPSTPEAAESSVSGIFRAPQSRNQDSADWATGGLGQGEKEPSEAGKTLRGRSTDRPMEEAPAPAPSAPSEFTQLFQSKVSAGTPAPPTPPAASEPGEFTRMFSAPVSRDAPARPAPSPVAPPPAAKSAPGDFTQFFQPSLRSTPFEVPKSSAPPSEPPAPSPGEYTRLFRSPAPPSSQARSSGATGVFHAPSGQPPSPLLPADVGPSDFTRMIQSQPQPAPETSPPETLKAPPPEPAARKPAVPAVLIAVLAALAVLAIGMVLFFALRR